MPVDNYNTYTGVCSVYYTTAETAFDTTRITNFVDPANEAKKWDDGPVDKLGAGTFQELKATMDRLNAEIDNSLMGEEIKGECKRIVIEEFGEALQKLHNNKDAGREKDHNFIVRAYDYCLPNASSQKWAKHEDWPTEAGELVVVGGAGFGVGAVSMAGSMTVAELGAAGTGLFLAGGGFIVALVGTFLLAAGIGGTIYDNHQPLPRE